MVEEEAGEEVGAEAGVGVGEEVEEGFSKSGIAFLAVAFSLTEPIAH